MSVFIMRHFQRGDDPSYFTTLTTDGQKRAKAFFIPDIKRIVTSPFIRCIQSVKPFAESNNIPMYVSCDLAEYIDDERHGITLETKDQLRQRVARFMLNEAMPKVNTLYVTHQSVAKMMGAGILSEGEVVELRTIKAQKKHI